MAGTFTAGLHAVSGRTLQSSSQRRLAQAAQLRFRQSGCDGIQFAVTARPSMRMDDTTAHGTVVIRNLNNVSIPLAQVTVQVNRARGAAAVPVSVHMQHLHVYR